MYEFKYTCQVIDANGQVTHTIPTEGYFSSVALLVYWLEQWTGQRAPDDGTWKYFLTNEQIVANYKAKELNIEELPDFRVGWYGKQQHEHIWLYDMKKEARSNPLRGLFNLRRLASNL